MDVRADIAQEIAADLMAVDTLRKDGFISEHLANLITEDIVRRLIERTRNARTKR